MGKKSRRKQEQRKITLAKKGNIQQTLPKLSSDRKLSEESKPKPLYRYILPAFISFAFFIASNYGANMLNDKISPVLAYILMTSSFAVLGGYWWWKFIGWVEKGNRNIPLIQRLSTAVVIIIVIATSPIYKDLFIKSNSSIEMPTFIDNSTQILVYYGNKSKPFMWTQTTVGELRQNSNVPLRINGQDIFTVHINEKRLYIDADVFAGYGREPVKIKDNAFTNKPRDWKIYQNNTALEIVNDDGLPVLLLKYENPYKIIISGMFVTPMGVCKVDNDDNNQFTILTNKPEIYRIDRMFIRSLLDLFESERNYMVSVAYTTNRR